MKFQFPCLVSIALSLCTAAAAQSTITSPFGYDSTEGATNHAYILGNRVGLTWQQIDSTLRNHTFVAKSIAWRRDATTATGTDFVARTMDMELVLAKSDLTTISTTHTANYVGTPTVVMKKKTVSAPDWNPQPATTPAPFNFVVPFDTSYIHLAGPDDFLWEVRVSANSYTGTAFSNYPYDFQYVVSGGSFSNGPNASVNTALGTGCSVTPSTNFNLAATLYNHGIKFRFVQSVTNGPANSGVTTYVGAQDLNAAIPGWCEKVRTDTTFVVPLGMTDASGSIGSVTIDDILYIPGIVGLPIYSQAVTNNPKTNAIALSNGVKMVVATDPAYPKVGRVYTYNVGTGSTMSGPWTGGIIAQFK